MERKLKRKISDDVIVLCADENNNECKGGIDNEGFSMADEGVISSLSDRALLKVFSFTSLVDRGHVAR